MDSNVIIIPRKNPIQVDAATGTLVRKKVAAYARVSTDEKDQLNSFNTQKIEYERRIKENPEWEFVGLYADEGITGTNLKKREGFKNMIQDSLDGKIDLILVKSISRFARNTVDCIKTKRQLAAAGVEVFFEKENIYTLKEDSETMITIHAALAQDESRQISTNVSWGNRARMRSGTYRGLNKKNLGYIIKENNEFEIEEEGKETVQLIYKLFINGFSYRRIVCT